MADKNESNATYPRSFEPGTLEKTRKAIGPVDAEEAQRMVKVLGGEILPERSLPINPKSLPKRAYNKNPVVHAKGVSSADISEKSAAQTSTTNLSTSKSVDQIASSLKKIKTEEELPAMTPKDLKLIDKEMRSYEYEIKPNYGLFNFLLNFSPRSREKVTREYGDFTIQKNLEHLQNFIGAVKTFIQIAPDTYKQKIANEPDLKFRLLRTVGHWTTKDLKLLASDLQSKADDLTVSMLIPFTRSVYRMLITIYYIGEQQVPNLLKEVHADLLQYPDADKVKLLELAKNTITEWFYIYNRIIRGMYPLLMRMCSPHYEPFPTFFTSQVSAILQFVHLTKFDLLLPAKKPKKDEQVTKEKKAEEKKPAPVEDLPGKKDELVDYGLKILEQLFPDAGFSRLSSHPDMYPYFQPLYNFKDGFNLLNPQNGIQVTVVLLKIIEDLFQGCHNIDFNIGADEKLGALKDNINDVMNEWIEYREDLFERKYCDYLRNFVNQLYSQSDYARTQYGRETLTFMLWQTKYYFLPFFEFTQILLEKPKNDSKYTSLYKRTAYMRTVLTALVKHCDEQKDKKGSVVGVMNPWEKYSFGISNTVSKRLDVLLGAKKSQNSAATNANLLKYTLCIMAVLDWWINNKESPAYDTDPKIIYRVSTKDGGPEFSVPVRNDQNKLFAESVKKAIGSSGSDKK